jgi:hypothetical protein
MADMKPVKWQRVTDKNVFRLSGHDAAGMQWIKIATFRLLGRKIFMNQDNVILGGGARHAIVGRKSCIFLNKRFFPGFTE